MEKQAVILYRGPSECAEAEDDMAPPTNTKSMAAVFLGGLDGGMIGRFLDFVSPFSKGCQSNLTHCLAVGVGMCRQVAEVMSLSLSLCVPRSAASGLRHDW